MWQARSHVSDAKINLQDSMHQAQAHHPWNEYCAQRSTLVDFGVPSPPGIKFLT